jgi:hypothetical protein
MIGYTLKHILDLVPEAMPLVKSANLEAEFPLGNRDECLASALTVQYLTKVANKPVDFDILEKVAYSVAAYGLEDQVSELSSKLLSRNKSSLEKQAGAETEVSFLEKEANWEGDLTGFPCIENLVKQAGELIQKAANLGITPSDKLRIYGGDAYLCKRAALESLGSRHYASKNGTYAKIAAALSKEAEYIKPGSLVNDLCTTVTRLDKEAGLLAKGFNFYKETLLTKQAASSSMTVGVCGKQYPLQTVLAMPSEYTDSYLGKGFSEQLNADPASAKAMVESLPMDTQNILATILKSQGR